jgi:integrase
VTKPLNHTICSGMGRPKEAIKAQLISGTDRYRVIFAEHPEWYFNTRFIDSEVAKQWAKKNKELLFAERQKDTLSFRALGENFFKPGSPWRSDQETSGVKRIDQMYKVYNRMLTQHILPVLGDKNAATILGKEIKTAINGTSTRDGRPLARATKNRCLYIISMMYKWWISQGIVTSNPVDSVTKYNDSPENPRGAIPRVDRAKMFSDDVEALIEFWGSTMWAAFFSIMNDTGARNGEPRALKWGDIDLDREFIPLMKAIETGTTAKVKGTKNAKMKPGWPTKTTIEVLKRWRKETPYHQDTDWIFIYSRKGGAKKPVSNEAVLKAFNAAMEGNGYGDRRWTPYWLRHTFITYGQEVLSLDDIKLLAGDYHHIDGYDHTDEEALYKKGLAAKVKLDKERG